MCIPIVMVATARVYFMYCHSNLKIEIVTDRTCDMGFIIVPVAIEIVNIVRKDLLAIYVTALC
jgi:hypothetical protein